MKAGEPLFVLESEKAAHEVEAMEDGILRIAPDGLENGTTVPVGRVVGYLVQEGETDPFASLEVSSVSPTSSVEAAPISRKEAPPTPPPSAPRAPPIEGASRQRSTITPRALRLAHQLGVDWESLEGSGRGGRIREQDVREAESDK